MRHTNPRTIYFTLSVRGQISRRCHQSAWNFAWWHSCVLDIASPLSVTISLGVSKRWRGKNKVWVDILGLSDTFKAFKDMNGRPRPREAWHWAWLLSGLFVGIKSAVILCHFVSGERESRFLTAHHFVSGDRYTCISATCVNCCIAWW